MKRLHLLVLKSFIGPFILTFFIVLFVLLMQFLWRYIDDLIGKGLEFMVIGELLLYTSSSLVPMALPLAILMASLMTFGNMGEFYELTAIKASGISLQRIMMPLFTLVILISIGAFFFANEVLPYTNLKMRSLLYDVRNQRPEISILPGSFYNGIDGYSMRVERRNPSSNMLYDIKIHDHTQNRGNASIILADSGKMIVTQDERNLIFTLYNGYSYNELETERSQRKKRTYPHRYDRFEQQEIIIELSDFSLKRTDESLFRNHYQMLDLKQLTMMGDSLNKQIISKENMLSKTLLLSNYFRKKNKDTRAQNIEANRIDTTLRKTSMKNYKQISEKRNPPPRHLLNTRDTLQKKLTEAFVKKTNKDSSIYLNLYDQLTLKEQDAILSSALSYSRSARTYVVGNVNDIDSKIRNLRKFEIEWHRKFTIAFACFVFLLIGAPLGAIIRKGGLGLPLVLSTLFFIFYYIISLMGEKFVRESIMPGYQGMWMGSAIFFITGIFLTYKATTDAAILNLDTYTNFIRKSLGIRPVNLMESLEKENRIAQPKPIKHDKLIASLNSFRDTIGEIIEDVRTQLTFSGFLLSLTGLHDNSYVVLMARLYRNILFRIKSSDLIDNQAVKNKLEEFPDFRNKSYLDLKWRLYVRFFLLLIPPVTLIILIRHYVQLHSLRVKLKKIDQLTIDLIKILNKNSSSESLHVS